MRQHARFKGQHPDCLLMFRMGDFYEFFGEDARLAHRLLGLTLSQRSTGMDMAGVPHHQLDRYLAQLVRLGVRVAVCDQVQDPKDAKGVVDRAVTQVVTPGTLVDESLLDADASCRVAAAALDATGTHAGIAVVELSTGTFTVTACPAERLADELSARGVTELIADQGHADDHPIALAAGALEIPVSPRAGWQFRATEAAEALREQFGVATLEGFGLSDDAPETRAAGALVRYLLETQSVGSASGDEPSSSASSATSSSTSSSSFNTPHPTLDHLRPPRRDDRDAHLVLDAASLRALEIERTLRSERPEGALLGLFLGERGAFKTPMGRRLIREWLRRPSADLGEIARRHDAVGALVHTRDGADAIAALLEGWPDAARIVGRLALDRVTPRDLVGLGGALGKTDAILTAIEPLPELASIHAAITELRERLVPLAERIESTCVETPPAHLRDGGLIRDGVDTELDEARTLARDAGTWLSDYQAALIEEHELPSLKVGFNRVFGYYIELPAAQARRAPDGFTRKQTLKNAERYITPELKDFEDKVTTAEGRALERERILFEKLRDAARRRLAEITRFAEAIGELDCFCGLAEKARRRSWMRPVMADDAALDITEGRHPVLDELLGDRFVANGTQLGPQHDGALALITGPNMAGKSTFIRQTALLVVLAHAGSFVPAAAATIGRCDRVFTRVGADDALHRGQSTFMVEMTETANILNHATPQSLVVLDEIGRGTSTLDGLSLAWAIAEHLAGSETAPGPRTLFATHYHELTELDTQLPGRVKNLHVAVREWQDDIVFLHRILPGAADQSYGIHVARLAGVPDNVTRRARDVLRSLSVHQRAADAERTPPPPIAAPGAGRNRDTQDHDGQLGLFTEFVAHPAVDRLRMLDLDRMSPMDAFEELRRLRDNAGETTAGGPAPKHAERESS